MPELPEVETTRRFIAPVVEGKDVDEVVVTHPRMLRRQPLDTDFADRFAHRRILRLGRRGKFLLWELEGDLTGVVHLGMSGRMRVVEPGEPPVAHTHVVWHVDGREVQLIDPRTFGFVACLTPDEAEVVLAGIGPDALTDPPGVDDLVTRLAGRRSPIKAMLLDQRIVAGLGNIYADEVLHRAGVDPRRPAGSLDRGELDAVVAAIPHVLGEALIHGGTSLDDLAYLLPDGRAGEFLDRLAVYGRTDRACAACGTPIRRVVVAQRSTHWCPICQK